MEMDAFIKMAHEDQEAYFMGQASGSTSVPEKWKTNPYPPGRQHELYDQGKADVLSGKQKFIWPE
jgi:hypothetical protein